MFLDPEIRIAFKRKKKKKGKSKKNMRQKISQDCTNDTGCV